MAWIDMWTGVWTGLWGSDVPDASEMGDFYNTQVEIYVDTAFGTLVDIINARYEPSVLSELGGHGAGSFKVSKNDPKVKKNPGLLDFRNYVKIRLNGNVIGGFIIQTKKTTIVGAGEERDETWEISGEGPRSWTKDASVYPPKGLKSTSGETRYFNFSTERGSWYVDANWPWAKTRWLQNHKGSPKWPYPANWPDVPQATWIAETSYTPSVSDPVGFSYYRHEFTTPGSGTALTSYAFFVAVDDAAEVYVDGEQKAILEAPGYYEVTRIELELLPGPHVIGVKTQNFRGLGEMLGALFTYGDPAKPTSAQVVNHTGMTNTWRVNAYPAQEPGWTTGDVLLTLLDEAKARGVRFANNFTPTFSSTTDSSGAAWSAPVPWSFEVGATYEDVISAAEELGCDIYVNPDTLEFHVWNKRGTDRSHAGLLNGPLVVAMTNRIPNPNQVQSGSATWVTGGGTGVYTSGKYISTSNASTTFYQYPIPVTEDATGARFTVSPGQKVAMRAKVNNPNAATIWARAGFGWYNSSGGSVTSDAQVLGPIVQVNPGASVVVEAIGVVPNGVSGTLTGTLPLVYQYGNAAGAIPPTGTLMDTSEWSFYSGPTAPEASPLPFFTGDTATDSVGLAKYRWYSTANRSFSIMEVPSQFGGVIDFSPGHNLVAADETGQAEIANTMMLRTPEGWSEATAQDATSLAKYGRVETQMSTKLTAAGASNLVQELFRQKALPEISATFDIVPTQGMIPFIHFNVGDWVSAPGQVPGVKERRRVMSIAFTEDMATGLPLYAVEFDTIFKDRQTELEKWLSRISNSSAISGGFTNSNSLPSSVVTVPPGAPLGVVPDAPTGLTVSTVGKYQSDGGSSSDYGLTWNAVVTGTGFGSVEIEQYEVWGRLTSSTDSQLLGIVFDTFAYFTGFRPGEEWAFKVRAISRSGGAGEFTPEVSLVAAAPQVPLAKPSKPTLASSFGAVTVKWDGLLGGNPAPPYVRYVRVERAPDGTNTWSSVGTLTNYSMQDIPGSTGVSFKYRLVAVDTYGNTSTPSDPETIEVKGVNSGDITGGLASNNLVANGSFEDGFSPFWTVMTKHSTATSAVQNGNIAGAKYLMVKRLTEPVGEETEFAIGQSSGFFIPVSSVGEFGYFISAKAAAQTSPLTGAFSLRAHWYLADKVTPASTEYDTAVDTADLTTQAQYFTGRVYPPSDARFMRVVIVNTLMNSTILVDDVVAREAITPNMIGENVLLAEHFSAGSVTTNALQSESVTTEILAAEAVQAENISAGAIQVSHLSPSVGDSIDISANASVNILINRQDQLQTDLDETNGTVTELTTYYSFGPDGAIIGQTDSAFKLYLKNDRIEILENGIVVSYWDSGRMVVPSFVGEEVVLGNHKLEKYSTGTVVRAI